MILRNMVGPVSNVKREEMKMKLKWKNINKRQIKINNDKVIVRGGCTTRSMYMHIRGMYLKDYLYTYILFS